MPVLDSGPVLEAGRLRADDYVLVADDAPLPDGPAILPLARLRAEAAALDGRNAPLGVLIDPEVSPDDIADLLPRLALVALRFPKAKDGRAFTQARALREHHGFAGELRATGHVLPDHIRLWLRVGGSTVAVPAGTDPDAWSAARDVVGIAYQVAQDQGPGLGLRRHRLEVV